MLSDYPALAKEFHPSKNLPLTPDTVPANYSKKVWWLLPYDDPRTGKHFDFEWQAGVNQRTLKGYGCPYLSGHAVWPGFNDLKTLYPKIASEWHPTKNGDLLPSEIAYGSGKKVWWLLPYDDPSTGKHFDFEWESTVNSRTGMNAGCPYLTGAVWSGYNDLATKNPELAKEWSDRNELSPSEVTEWSNKLVWWHLPYDDPKTGKHFEFEWKAKVSRRSMGDGCPYLSGHAVLKGFNDLETLYPQIASEWHPTKNKVKASEVHAYSGKKVWWFLPYDDPKTGKHFDFEWEMMIVQRTFHGRGCPYLTDKNASTDNPT